jgi:hypothetical protein
MSSYDDVSAPPMSIKVAVEESTSPTEKGRLLESLIRNLLQVQGYDVVGEVQFTGMELDLLAKHKQSSKQIYVECKALVEDEKIQSDVIKNLVGICNIKNYSEGWLISTTELGKQAKGLVMEISESKVEKKYSFYSPSDLISVLISSKIVPSPDSAKGVLSSLVNSNIEICDPDLIISSRGLYWAFPCKESGSFKGVVFSYHLQDGFVKNVELLKFFEGSHIYSRDVNIKKIYELEIGQDPVPATCPDVLSLNSVYEDIANQIGMRIEHPNKGALKLSDVFVFPALELTETEDKDRIDSARLATIEDQFGKCLVYGDELSGKTALAHNLQKEIAKRGKIPIYLDAKDIKSGEEEKFKTLLKAEFKRQYVDNDVYRECFSETLQTDSRRIVIILDDFDNLSIRRLEAKEQFVRLLEALFGGVIIFANKNFEITLMADSATRELFAGFVPMKILQLGYILRDKLIEKWLTVEVGDSLTDAEIHNRTVEMSGKVRLAVGTNFVPTYPVFLITILQLMETASKTSLQGSSYAELYAYLITHSLGSANAKPEDLDFYLTYLSFLAHYLFKAHVKLISTDDLRIVFRDYCTKMEVDKKFEQIHSLLRKAQVLRTENEGYSFGHNYSYYFFVAKYLSDNSEEADIQKTIDELISQLYRSEYANVVLFLIHHSKSKDLVKKVLQESKGLHIDVDPYRLTGEQSEKINKMIQDELDFEITDEKPSDLRKKQLEQKDVSEKKRKVDVSDEPKSKEELDTIGQVNLGFKLIQLLGQITTNYYGSLDGEQKREIIEEIHTLGLKGLAKLLESLNLFTEALKIEILRRAESKNATPDETEQVTNKIIYSFTQMIATIFVKRIGDSITSKNIFPSLDKYAEQDGSPSARLVNLAAKLNFPGGLNAEIILSLDKNFSGNGLSRRLLRMLVIDHLYKFDVPFAEKQSLCDKLGIRLVQKRLR